MTFPFNVTRELGLRLTSADTGDVIFEATDDQSETRYLYAWKAVLTTRCEYYNTSFVSNAHLLTQVLKSGFSEGHSNGIVSSMRPENQTLRRSLVKVADAYDLLHNILFYLHTDIISFANDFGGDEESEQGFPKLCAAEDIYEIAD